MGPVAENMSLKVLLVCRSVLRYCVAVRYQTGTCHIAMAVLMIICLLILNSVLLLCFC